MCVQDFFSLALAPSSLRLGNEAGRARRDLLPLCLLRLPLAMQLEGPQCLWGERDQGALRSQMGQKGPHRTLGIGGTEGTSVFTPSQIGAEGQI